MLTWHCGLRMSMNIFTDRSPLFVQRLAEYRESKPSGSVNKTPSRRASKCSINHELRAYRQWQHQLDQHSILFRICPMQSLLPSFINCPCIAHLRINIVYISIKITILDTCHQKNQRKLIIPFNWQWEIQFLTWNFNFIYFTISNICICICIFRYFEGERERDRGRERLLRK